MKRPLRLSGTAWSNSDGIQQRSVSISVSAPVFYFILSGSEENEEFHSLFGEPVFLCMGGTSLRLSSVLINLLVLGFFKYADFLIQTVNLFFDTKFPLLNLPLPIGISFYTFQTMSYTIDVYRGEAQVQKNLLDFGVYVTMFPQLIAGPIVKYREVQKQLHSRDVNLSEISEGMKRFCIGLVCCQAGLEFWPLLSRFILISQVIRIWPSAWAGCWDLYFRRISSIPIFPGLSPSFGAGGIFRWAAGFGNTCIFPWGAIERGWPGSC